jgi:hypothetical protein
MSNIDLTIPAFLDRRPKTKPLILSYTILNTYRNICPHQAYRRYIKKDLPYVETPQMAFGNKVHLALEHRVAGGKPLPQDMHQWEKFAAGFYQMKAKAEMKLGITKEGKPCDFFADDVWLRGKLDVTVLNGASALLFDYKTGKVREDPFELEVQALLLAAKWPDLTAISGCFLWLSENRIGQKHDLSHTRDTWIYVNRIAEDLAEDIHNDDFEKRRGGLCDWCPCDDCEHFTGGTGRK